MPALPRRIAALRVCVVCAAIAVSSCGKKGPPLAPLRLVPAPVSEVTARRVGNEVQLRFKLPTANANGPGAIDLARVEIYAVTVAPGTVTPPNRDLLTRTYVVGTIPVKPPPVEGEEPTDKTPPDGRPAPGEEVTFVEQLNEARMTPAPLPKAPAPPAAPGAPGSQPGPGPSAAASATHPDAPAGTPPATTPPPVPALPEPGPLVAAGTSLPIGSASAQPTSGAAAPAVPPAPAPEPVQTVLVRTYAIRGIARSGRPGGPSARIIVPLVPPPPPPTTVTPSFTEKGVVVQWTEPAADPAGPAPAFNVYRAGTAGPLNPSPLAVPTFEAPGVEAGVQQCFTVRSVAVIQSVPIEGDASTPACVTPQDIFPPAPPQGLSLLLLDGAIELVWDAGTEPDIAGYMVLRGDSPGDTLRPLTSSPIRESTYRDATVTPGARYFYAITAVDRSGNASPRSAPVEGTAR